MSRKEQNEHREGLKGGREFASPAKRAVAFADRGHARMTGTEYRDNYLRAGRGSEKQRTRLSWVMERIGRRRVTR